MVEWLDAIPSAWKGHASFAEWIVKEMGVRRVVELGVDRGFSLFCFALAGVEKIYGIDLWQPDQDRPDFGYDDYYPHLLQVCEEHQLSNVELIKSEFGEAARSWTHGKVDLLHIDGTHTYEAVKTDFENWLPHLKEDGIILLHDVAMECFTVHEFFNEIPLPKAWFAHSAGLGVVCRDPAVIHKIQQAFPSLHVGNIPL
jgi:predicted O-methyltransferase YrrM